jgi:hypothetical protein
VKVLSEQVSTVEDLRDGPLADVHNTRLRFYSDCMLHTVDQLLEHIVHNEQGYPVSGFRELSFDKEAKQFLVRVAWHGFEPDDDTVEPLQNMYEDVPAKLDSYLARHPDQRLVARARASLA